MRICGVDIALLGVPFERYRDRIRLLFSYLWSETEDITGTAETESSTAVLDAALSVYPDGTLTGRLVRVTHANGRYEDRFVAGNSADGNSILLDGSLDAPCAIGDTYRVTENYLWMRFSRYFWRFSYTTEEPTKAQVLPFDSSLEPAFIAGLRWKAAAQGDATTQIAMKAEQDFRRQMDNVFSTMPVVGEESVRNEAREMPQF